ncbi:uncharacterized protein RHIMIDRAFT_237713 [Rhizopus microsporus ATCC 52813]|uniref:P-loop containing nucleoside triphosphate hydrolase protein n=1 Tax=Rhizopus microsporus ATCC 52813 TaxID=1340429 RepID=A0A2G4SVJ8_RHIZD|nr:uncharacterized protein RHIMIDRAFT_237713 [Rhizopus microsporus ATCC 52813]PHZ12799.1 hypothetical protein RHIMIDRAFT_237713 [Rhizopus microsporus ATCC 52813]
MRDLAVILPEQRFQNCELCEQGQFLSIYRLSVRPSVESRPVLIHAHYSESLQTLLARLCDEYPAIWQQNTVYYFYMDMGGVYHHVEDATWLRDKDQLIVTTIEDAELFPKLNLMAVHASLRPHVKLRPHQKEGVERMIFMEKVYRGGILADDMGLGKTLQTLTLILRQQPRLNVHAPTLVVIPSIAVGEQWADEIRSKTEFGSIPYFIYQDDNSYLLDQPVFRVVIVTYDRVRMEFKKYINGDNNCPLYKVDWYRIVLDESHKVRALRTMLSDAVLQLRGKYKWCLSGTPIQNNITELYPIFAFLQVDINQKLKTNKSYMAELLKLHMIRRNISILHTESVLLPRQEIRITLEFTESERALYDYLEKLLYDQTVKNRRQGEMYTTFATTAILYLRLKQVCGHHMILLDKFPDLIPMAQAGVENEILDAFREDEEELIRERVYSEGLTEYEHIVGLMQSYYEQFGDLENQVNVTQLQKLKFIRHSTKVSWLINFLQNIMENNPTDKVFVDLLNKVAEALSYSRIPHQLYHGGLSSYRRKQGLQMFNYDPKMRVMVMSLKAGGIGLNLQKANHMVVMDRWWNPATMDQAVARIHRMTQSKQTYIYTIVMKNTIEETILDDILTKKNKLFQMVVETDQDEAEEEIRPAEPQADVDEELEPFIYI